MKRTAAALALAGILAAVLFSAGCSGPGVTAASVRGASVQEIAADHLSAVLLVKSWFAILHQKEGEGNGEGCEPTFDMEFFPDGSMRFWGRTSDCQLFDYTQAPDGSGSGTMTDQEGRVATIAWGPEVWDGDAMTQDLQETLWDGTRLEYTSSIDFTVPEETPQSWDGSATLPDGRRMDFVLNRSIRGEDHLVLALPDGSQLEVRVPLTEVPGAAYWPVFSQGARGVFTPAAGQEAAAEQKQRAGRRLDFTLTGQRQRWDRWEFTCPDGTEGAFTLGDDFGGSGQLTREGTVTGALRWLPTGFGTLDLVAAASAEVSPSAAALDFQIDQWVSTIVAMGPAPMY